MKIVIADDSEMVRVRIREIFNGINDFEIVGEATNGIEAVNIIEKEKPDFILLDIRMPGMSGIEVLQKIRASGNKAKVCIFTNYPYSQYKRKCMEEGADYFLDKNMDLNKIPVIIAELAKTLSGEAAQ